jgi:hypothetical protein
MLGKPVMSLYPGSGQLDKLDIFVALITGDLSVGNLTSKFPSPAIYTFHLGPVSSL